jgi:hypothetical protein
MRSSKSAISSGNTAIIYFPALSSACSQPGAARHAYVVEADHPEFAGLLHIFTEDQLVLREAEAAGRPLTPR